MRRALGKKCKLAWKCLEKQGLVAASLPLKPARVVKIPCNYAMFYILGEKDITWKTPKIYLEKRLALDLYSSHKNVTSAFGKKIETEKPLDFYLLPAFFASSGNVSYQCTKAV